MSAPVVINFAPTGMVPTREMTPHVPLQPDEIVREVCEAARLGITVVHIHAREKDGTPTHDPKIFGEIISAIRAREPDLVICVSLSGRHLQDASLRAAPLYLTGELKPDMASLTLGSVNFASDVSHNPPATIQDLSRRMLDVGVVPELEVFDLGMINYARYLIRKGAIRPPYYFNLLLGNVASAQCDLVHAGLLVRELPPDSLWALAGLGRDQLAAAALSIATGGGVRVGLEDNVFLDRERRSLATNLSLLERIHALAQMFERPIMQPSEFRERLKLRPGPNEYGRAPCPAEE